MQYSKLIKLFKSQLGVTINKVDNKIRSKYSSGKSSGHKSIKKLAKSKLSKIYIQKNIGCIKTRLFELQ